MLLQASYIQAVKEFIHHTAVLCSGRCLRCTKLGKYSCHCRAEDLCSQINFHYWIGSESNMVWGHAWKQLQAILLVFSKHLYNVLPQHISAIVPHSPCTVSYSWIIQTVSWSLHQMWGIRKKINKPIRTIDIDCSINNILICSLI